MTTTGEQDRLDRQLRRTLVPMVAGALLAQFARWGLDIPAEVLTGALEAVFMGLYYVVFAVMERHVPWAGVLIGAIGRPSYPDPLDDLDLFEEDR
jgi:hypothetical protein